MCGRSDCSAARYGPRRPAASSEVGVTSRAPAARSDVEDGDTIVVDPNQDRLDCRELADATVHARRAAAWKDAAARHGGVHPT
jgi:hypothetical protein